MRQHIPLLNLLATLGFMIAAVSVVSAQTQPRIPMNELPLQPRSPSGYLTNTLGMYLTIEGVLYSGNGKVESNSMVVDAINGIRLNKTILVLVRNVRLPPKQRCVLKGYELGEMIGRPPAEYALTRELGRDPNELASRDATGWRWRPYFVPLVAVEPRGLKVTTKWGIAN